MQDELTKHGLKIYKTMADRKHTFGEKLKEIIIEILIIVFAVSLSIWLHGWSEHRHEQKEVREFLSGLRTDLGDDILLLKDSRDTIEKTYRDFDYFIHLDKTHWPSVLQHDNLYYSAVVTHLNKARYEGFRSSGKIGNIENESLRQAILVYYQQVMPAIEDKEQLVNTLQEKLLDFQIDNANISLHDFLAKEKAMGMIQITAANIRENIKQYDTSIEKAKHLREEVEKQLR